MNSPFQRTLLHAGLILLILWSVLESGGRYLFGQSLSQVLCGGLLLLVVLTQLRTGVRIQTYPLLGVTALWLLALLVSGIFSINRLASLEELLRYLMYLSLPLLTFLCLKSAQNLEKMSWVMLCTALLVCLIGWFRPGESGHLASTFNRTNDLAGYLLIVIPLALHQLLMASGLLKRLLLGLISTSLIVSLILTQSRSSWVACLISMGCLFYFNRQTLGPRTLRRWIFGLLALILTSFLLNWTTLAPRLTTLTQLEILQENATAWRLELLRGAWRIFQDFPILGSGPNTFGAILPAYQSQPGYFSINPHNYYLQMLAETGLIGFLACLCYLAMLLRQIYKNHNQLMPAALAGLSASLFHTGFDIDWSVSATPILFFLFAGMGLSQTQTEPVAAEISAASRLLLQTLGLIFGLTLILLPAMNQWSSQAFASASIAWEQHQTEKARQALIRARELAPWPSGRHHALQADIELKTGHPDLALRFILKALELDRYNTTYMKTAATALIQLGKIPQAEAILEKRIRLTPYRHPEYYRELGDLLWQRHKIEAARKVYRQGLNAFPPEVIPRYERYTPSHRYELFMLYQHAAQLANSQKNTSDAKKLEVQAQDLLKTATADLFVTSGFNAPVTALKNYWLNLGKKQQQLSLQTEDPLPPPPSELKFDPSQLLFLQARRDIFSAELVYLIPIRSPGDSHWHPLILKDYLQGFPDGWKIIRREPVKANTSEP